MTESLIAIVFFLVGIFGASGIWLYDEKRKPRVRTENEKLRAFVDSNECEEAHTKRGQCKLGRLDYRCFVCEARLKMREP